MSIAANLGIDIPRWMDDAACTETNPEEFFPATGVNVQHAKAICRACPVVNECLETALADPSIDGVWGGTTGFERVKLRKGVAA